MTDLQGTFLDGRYADGTGHTRTLIDPANGEPTASLSESGPDQVEAVVASARAALPGWSARTGGERCQALLALADAIESRREEFVAAEVRETGKPRAVFADGEFGFGLDNLRFFATAARSLEGSGAGVLSQGYTSMMLRRPVGVVAGIAPWNFPFIMAIWKLGPALAAGNTVVLKPAPTTPTTTLLLAEVAAPILGPGVLGVVTGEAEVGQGLVEHPDVAMVSITGSSRAGRLVAAAAAPTTKRLHLELGGKAPALVFADADLVATAQGIAMGATYNSGQDCTAVTRVYAHADVLDELTQRLVERFEAIAVGDPGDPDTDIGPLISVEHRARVQGFVDRAVAAGARVLTGGEVPAGPGAFYPPTLVVGAGQDSEIVQSEVFGPVLVVLGFDDEDDAVQLANDCEYGLASSIWTSDVQRALRVAHRIEAGVTWVNDHLPIASEAPHGGVKASGYGKDMSLEAVTEYTVTQHVMLKHDRPVVHDSFRPA